MHKVHNHLKLPYTDTIYGNIFSIWDRLLGTFSKMKNKEISYGIDTNPDFDSNSKIGLLLKLPFGRNRKVTDSKFSKK
jgi:sterol desaturase/sphingolipid hydroxylase (fatty acid hydroxylase superfamily)